MSPWSSKNFVKNETLDFGFSDSKRSSINSEGGKQLLFYALLKRQRNVRKLQTPTSGYVFATGYVFANNFISKPQVALLKVSLVTVNFLLSKSPLRQF